MHTISIINLKGGVAKTITAINMAHILSIIHNKRILLVDNDKQGNSSKTFHVHSCEHKSMANVLTDRGIQTKEVIRKTDYELIDVIPANMMLLKANMEVMMDNTRNQQTRLEGVLKTIENDYDYCIIDNAPDINISTINALVASDDVIIPIKIDEYAFDGLKELMEQIDNVRVDLNPKLQSVTCLITCFQRTEADKQGEQWLRDKMGQLVFQTHIRYSEKVIESTFAKVPIAEYSRRSAASMDYIKFVGEYLQLKRQ